MAWPGSGRPERGKQNGFPRSGNPFFYPRSVTSFVSPGKKKRVHILTPARPAVADVVKTNGIPYILGGLGRHRAFFQKNIF